MGMKLGVTASRTGLTLRQINKAGVFLSNMYREGYRQFHHGCCEGGDEQLAIMARQIGYSIVGHPPTYKGYLMKDMWINDVLMEPKRFLSRNRTIVDTVDRLLVCPDSMRPRARSGTWYTFNYAQKKHLDTTLILPKDPVRK